MVRNNGSVNLTFVELTVTFYASNGSVIESDRSYSLVDILTPQLRSPYNILTSKSNPFPFDHYSVVITGAKVTTKQPNTDLLVQGTTHKIDSSGYYRVTGEVKNGGTTTVNYVSLVIAYYDSSGNLVDAQLYAPSPSTLQAGQMVSFNGWTTQSVSSIASFSVQAQSST